VSDVEYTRLKPWAIIASVAAIAIGIAIGIAATLVGLNTLILKGAPWLTDPPWVAILVGSEFKNGPQCLMPLMVMAPVLQLEPVVATGGMAAASIPAMFSIKNGAGVVLLEALMVILHIPLALKQMVYVWDCRKRPFPAFQLKLVNPPLDAV